MTDKHNEDELLRRMLHDLHNSIEIPEGTESWNTMKKKLDRRMQRKKKIRCLRISVGLLCVFMVLSLLITKSSPRAYASISSFFKSIQNHVIEIFLKKPQENPEDALTAPPPSEGSININGISNFAPEKVTLADAKEKLSFSILLPSKMPEDFKLEEVCIFKEADNQYRSVYFEYRDSQGSLVKLSERKITENSGIKTEIPEGIGVVKDINIRGNAGVLMILPEGMVNLEWIVADVKISLSGILSEKDVLNWAQLIL